MKTKYFCLLSALLCLLLGGCNKFKGDYTVPAYLDIEEIRVADTPGNSRSSYNGFFSSDIDCVEVVVYFEGDAAQTVLGVFELPCHVPVLREGIISKVIISPCVRQNGMAATHIYYPYYEPITLTDVGPLVPDHTVVLGALTTTYKANAYVAWSEFFEPGAQVLQLDSIVQRLDYHSANYKDTVGPMGDAGCGVLHIGKDSKGLSFWSKDTIDISKFSSDSYLYLELDIWNDIPLNIGFNNPQSQGGQSVVGYAVTVTSPEGWRKLYVNLGRLWTNYGSYPYLRLNFNVLNDEGKEGNIYIDNMKLMVI